MGIKFDKDIRRATNGPMIFFSDPSCLTAIAEEIRGAVISNLSFYCYRLPASAMITFGSSEGYTESFGQPGFVVANFNPDTPYITIPYKGCARQANHTLNYRQPVESTTRNEYMEEVKGIISDLKNEEGSKVVASRVLVEKKHIDLAEIFFNLCQRFPDAYIFCFSTPATGCWIGASPELLLEAKGETLHTMALAGTRPANVQEPWDKKNIEEHEIVSRYISEVFRKAGMTAKEGNAFTKKTGEIEHICTPFTVGLQNSDVKKIENLLHTLSPTPALCGFPRNEALQIIAKYEHFDRGCYGGFCGPFHSLTDFTFNVVLRCASVTTESICIYAGGGITLKSDPEAEWEETEIKIRNTFHVS